MSDEQRGQELIVGCLTASAAIAAASALAEGRGPGFRLVAGVAFTGVGLAVINMFEPRLAGGFAVLILTATLFSYGGPAMDAVSGVTTGARAKKNRTGTVQSPQNEEGVIAI